MTYQYREIQWRNTMKTFKKVFKRTHKNGLKISSSKRTFVVEKITFAGHIQSSKKPSKLIDVKSFLGMIN